MNTYIGCSGYYYDAWKGPFYPEELSKKEWLPFYAEHFNSVEINNSFYAMPDEKKLTRWHEQTPGDFRFTMKGSRYITHRKKLVYDDKVKDGVRNFYDVIEVLGGKLGCVLWQLPGNLHRNDEKLEKFCSLLSSNIKNVIEFRHHSWFAEPVWEILKEQGVSNCILSAPDDLPEEERTSTDTAYVRFHGKTAWYDYNYSPEEIAEWSRRIAKLSARRVYVYFNNDAHAYAPDNARLMQEKLAVKV